MSRDTGRGREIVTFVLNPLLLLPFRHPHYICQPYRRPAASAISKNQLNTAEREDKEHLQRKRLREIAEEELKKEGKTVSKNKLKKLMRLVFGFGSGGDNDVDFVAVLLLVID